MGSQLLFFAPWPFINDRSRKFVVSFHLLCFPRLIEHLQLLLLFRSQTNPRAFFVLRPSLLLALQSFLLSPIPSLLLALQSFLLSPIPSSLLAIQSCPLARSRAFFSRSPTVPARPAPASLVPAVPARSALASTASAVPAWPSPAPHAAALLVLPPILLGSHGSLLLPCLPFLAHSVRFVLPPRLLCSLVFSARRFCLFPRLCFQAGCAIFSFPQIKCWVWK